MTADIRYLMRGTVCAEDHESLYQSMKGELGKRLQSERPLRVKLGLDPKTPSLHVGHLAPLLSLRRFQEHGHTAYLLIGGFTARYGDPTGRTKARNQLKEEEIEQFSAAYELQARQLLDPGKLVVVNNKVWYESMSCGTFLSRLAAPLNLARLLAHRSFKDRFEAGRPLTMCELLYPALQAYDSMVLCAAPRGHEDDPVHYHNAMGSASACCDVEIGGKDQLFNFSLTRRLMEAVGLDPEITIALELVPGARGGRIGPGSNYIPFDIEPDALYRYIVSINDDFLIPAFQLITDLRDQEIASIQADLERGARKPQNIRKKLAHSVVKLVHGCTAADSSEKAFESRHRGIVPTRTFVVTQEESVEMLDVCGFLCSANLASSMSDAQWLIEEKSVSIDGREAMVNDVLHLRDGMVVQRGSGKHLSAAAVRVRVADLSVTLPTALSRRKVSNTDIVLIAGLAKHTSEAETLLQGEGLRFNGSRMKKGDSHHVLDGSLLEMVGESGDPKRVIRLDVPD